MKIPRSSKSPSVRIVAGMLVAKLAGLARERVFAHYLGNSVAAGAFRAALALASQLQVMLGEGPVAASFVPPYARLIAEERTEEAARLARLLLAMLLVIAAGFAAIGVGFSDELVRFFAPGFQSETRELTARLVAVIFPGMSLLIVGGWCIGILNSHRRFFLSYAAPVLWQVAIIAAFFAGGARALAPGALTIRLAWGTVIGAACQLGVQLPWAWRQVGGGRFIRGSAASARALLRDFGAGLGARALAQGSFYIEQMFASFLGSVTVAAFAYAQVLYQLPVILFGFALSTAELTEMSRATGSAGEIASTIAGRLETGISRLAFVTVPSTIALSLLGNVVIAACFQTGSFGEKDVVFVWGILAAAALGIVPVTQSRLCISAFWALGDTFTPAACAALRIALTALFGYFATLIAPPAFGWTTPAAAAALAVATMAASQVEAILLRYSLRRKIGRFAPPARQRLLAWSAATAAALLVFGLRHGLHTLPLPAWGEGGALLLAYAGIYQLLMRKMGSPQAARVSADLRAVFSRH